MTDLSGYSVEFFRVPLFGTWSYRITTPDGRTLRPIYGLFGARAAAERDAARTMTLDADRDSMTGAELAAKIRRAAE